MRIQIEPTEILCTLDGVKVRVWNGVTDEDVQCFLFVQCVAVRAGDDPLSLADELVEYQGAEIREELRQML